MSSPSQDIPEVSLKSTKDQILAAYNAVLKRLEAKQLHSPLEEKKQTDNKARVEKASQSSPETIITEVATLKLSLTHHLDTLSHHLTHESTRLKELQEAIRLEQEHLQTLYNIKETLHTFSALLLAQEEQKETFVRECQTTKAAFEQDMEDKQELWQKNLTLLELTYTETKEALNKKRARDEENYTYHLEVSRRQDHQEYLLKKEALEKELDIRHHDIAVQEEELKKQMQEFSTLQQQVNMFPEELSKAIETTTQTVTETLGREYTYRMNLKAQEVEGEKKLLLQKIEALEKRLKDYEELTTQLIRKADEAIHQVESIAYRALDTSSQRVSYSSDVRAQPSSQERVDK